MKKHNHKVVDKLKPNEYGIYELYQCPVCKKVITRGKKSKNKGAFGKAKILR